MPELLSQSDVRPARDLSFCYLCGGAIHCKDERHPDHIPPKAIFAEADRDFPLVVAAHRRCNNEHSPSDRVLGQLIAVVHGKLPEEHDLALDFQVYNVDGIETPFLGVRRTSLVGQIARWVHGFHAAIYHEYLPFETPIAPHPPFPHGELEEGGFTINKVLDQQYLFVAVLKKNRVARCLDRIVCNRGKMIYECVWVRMDDGQWACVFCLQIYDWARLADYVHFPKRGCVGWYQPAAGRPELGTVGTELEFAIQNIEALDGFGA